MIKSKINGGKVQLHVQATEVKEMAGKSATTHGSAETKNGGKVLGHVRRGGKMAGKSETMNLVDHQKIKWRENSTTRATMEVKEMAGKFATSWIS